MIMVAMLSDKGWNYCLYCFFALIHFYCFLCLMIMAMMLNDGDGILVFPLIPPLLSLLPLFSLPDDNSGDAK